MGRDGATSPLLYFPYYSQASTGERGQWRRFLLRFKRVFLVIVEPGFWRPKGLPRPLPINLCRQSLHFLLRHDFPYQLQVLQGRDDAARSVPLRRTITGRPSAAPWVSTAGNPWPTRSSPTRPGSSRNEVNR
jgi:hypothetical protein